jgi:hypothetical protein
MRPACLPCGAGSYGDSLGISSCKLCGPGSSNPVPGAVSSHSCVPCTAGSFSNVSGRSLCTLCDAGSFNPSNASASDADCEKCPIGFANPDAGSSSCSPCGPSTFAPYTGTRVCGACPEGFYCPPQSAAGVLCPAGSSCPVGSGVPCACKAFEYQPNTGASTCLPCLLAIIPAFNATSCVSQASPYPFLTSFYVTLSVIFCCISLAAVVLVVRLVRSRHAFSLRTVHTGTCIYVAIFVPYAALQAVTLGQLGYLNNRGVDSTARASVQISSSAAFAAFFGLGFSGKVALVQMWAHVVRMHTSGSCDVSPRLQSTLASTYKAFVWAVVCVVGLYVIGFSVLTNMFMTSVANCIAERDSSCLSSLQGQPCNQIGYWTSVIEYHEGVWAGIVILIFTALAFLFNGVVFAM